MTWRSRSVVAVASLAVVVLAAVWVWWGTGSGGPGSDGATGSGGPGSDGEIPSIAVLPLRNLSRDPLESDYLADGITQAVITKLVQTGLRVTPWDTAIRFRDTRQPAEQIARDLNVGAVLVGTFQFEGDQLLTTLSLVDAETGLVSWADEFEEPYENLFDVQRRIATGAAASLNVELTGDEAAALAEPESTSLEACDVYLQGAYLMQQGDMESTDVAFQYFTRAIAIDQSLAEAHTGLGSVYLERYWAGWGGGMGNLDVAEASYDAALRLNPADMRARRGLIHVSYDRGLFDAVLLHGQEAARLGRPGDIETQMARAQAYAFAGLSEAALPLYRRVIELDPLNLPAHFFFTTAAGSAGDAEAVVEIGTAAIERFGPESLIQTQLGFAHYLLNDKDRALEQFQRVTASISGAAAADGGAASLYNVRALLFAGAFYSRIGQRALAEQTWRTGIELFTPMLELDPDNTRMRLYFASLHGLVGDRDAFMAEEVRFRRNPIFTNHDIVYLVAGLTALGQHDRALALLREQVREGRLPLWESHGRLFFPDLLESPGIDELRREYDALEERLLERYVPAG